ncbi:MAG TPA: DegT/DnrJ/EryC1/StrS aminotransferase family protein [Chryseolinea sp.]|nr:DegT/DnrJ/EryC1/StrS aminotransferase family protein [Chryseolinea sp.]
MIPLMKNAFLHEHETKKALADFILNSDKLSMGEKCTEFETAFSKKQGREEAILFNSGGSANIALLQSLKNLGRLKEGDNIGFSALTWATNVMPIIQMGFNPVAIDSGFITLNLTSDAILKKIRDTKLNGLFITNALGFAGDLDNIKKLCEKNEIILLEDNCEALGTELISGKTGNFGLASTFSFFVAHHMSTIEGGMICTDDDELAEMSRMVRSNGWDRNLSTSQQLKWRKKYEINSDFEAKYTFYDIGFNLRPTEITGFLGLYQMQFIDETIKCRERNYLLFEDVLRKNPDLEYIYHDDITVLSTFAFPVICKNIDLKEKYMKRFVDAEIEIRPLIAGNIQNQPFYSKYVKEKEKLPQTDYLGSNGFYCGNYPELTDEDIETIIGCITK